MAHINFEFEIERDFEDITVSGTAHATGYNNRDCGGGAMELDHIVYDEDGLVLTEAEELYIEELVQRQLEEG